MSTGKEVIFVTGGLKQMVLPIATRVGVPEENIFSINLFFHDDAEGSYKGFDLDAFTASSFGKRRAVAHIKETRGFARVAMIG